MGRTKTILAAGQRCGISANLLAAALLLGGCQFMGAQADGFVSFDREVVDADFPEGYAVTLADIDGDGRQDIVALSCSPSALTWYRNPDWWPGPIVTGAEKLLDVAAHDITGNGMADLALASRAGRSGNTAEEQISWLENPARSSGEEGGEQWREHHIGPAPGSRHLAWADMTGTGEPILINVSIIGEGASAPDPNGGARLTAYNVPHAPRQRWGSVVLDDSLEAAHGLTIHDWLGNGRDELLTASRDGVDLFSLASRGRFIDRRSLLQASETEQPRAAIGAMAAGVSADALHSRFLATIEPRQGRQVVVYRAEDEGRWDRQIVDDSLHEGRALLTADLNSDGNDEIIAGGRGAPYGLNIYRYDPESRHWDRLALDSGGVAVAALAAADLTGNGYQDIVAVGSATANIVIYRNRGP